MSHFENGVNVCLGARQCEAEKGLREKHIQALCARVCHLQHTISCVPSSSTTAMSSPRESQDTVSLRLILVSGKTQDFTFSPNDSATDIARHVFENWPAGWEEEQVSSPSILRLIFQGRFLHGNVTLGALKLPPGRTTVMHLVARETLPEPNSHGQRNREKTTESSCCLLL
ncbi:ubiquitin-like 3b [Silurus meridionalis]|nr:ubiquitin-like 3b [Silurus meridionalis]